MIAFQNVKELEKILRENLIIQSELKPERVRNSLSIYGTQLDKLLSEEIYGSIEQSDCLLLFELNSRESTSDVSMTETEDNDDNSITYYKAFRLRVILYGDDSSDIALKLVARFRTEEVRSHLYEQGVYLEKISDPFKLNEFKNETMWIRNDIEIDIGCKFKIQPINLDSNFIDITELNIIQDEEE